MWNQISNKKQKPKYLTTKKRKGKKSFVKARQGHIKHVCNISGSISQKRRGHWTLKEFGASYLNQQPVSVMHWPKKTKKSSTDYDVKYIVIEAGMR